LGAQRAQLGEKTRIEDANTTFALNRLDDDRGGRVRAENDRKILDVSLAYRNTGGERSKRLAVRRTIRCSEGREQPTVKCATQRDDLVLGFATFAGPSARELERSLIRLSPRVA